MVRRLLAEHPHCQAGLPDICRGYSTDIHEVVTRARGGSITDEANLLALCRACHDWVTNHPKEAHELGLVKHSWERDEPTPTGGN